MLEAGTQLCCSHYPAINTLVQDGDVSFFRIKRVTSLEKVTLGFRVWVWFCDTLAQFMSSYCDRQSVDVRSIRFLFDGAAILPKSTPESLGANKP